MYGTVFRLIIWGIKPSAGNAGLGTFAAEGVMPIIFSVMAILPFRRRSPVLCIKSA
jgi:hypothetical protein